MRVKDFMKDNTLFLSTDIFPLPNELNRSFILDMKFVFYKWLNNGWMWRGGLLLRSFLGTYDGPDNKDKILLL